MYTFKVMSQDGTEVYLVPFEKITIREELNKGYDGQVMMAYPDIKQYAGVFGLSPDDIFATDPMEWLVERDGVAMWGGILMQRQINGGATGMTRYTVNFVDYSGLLNKRRTSALFTRSSTDSADIVEDLLDYTNGIEATGITMGAHPTTVDRDLTARFDRIRDLVAKMSNLYKDNGYDWDLDKEKKLNIYYPAKGTTELGIVFDEFNTLSFTSARPLQGKLTNNVAVIGAGFGDDIVTATREDTTSQTTWGLLEDTTPEKTVTTLAELQSRGDEFIDTHAYPTDNIGLRHNDGTPSVAAYDVGDTVKVRFDELGYDQNLRIIGRSITIEGDGNAVVDLTFEE